MSKNLKNALLSTGFVVFYFFYLTNVVKPQIEGKFFAKQSMARPQVTNPNYDLKKIYENPQSEEIFSKTSTFPPIAISLTVSPTKSPTITLTPTPTGTSNPTTAPSVTPTATITNNPTSTPSFTPTPTADNRSTPSPTPTPTTSGSSCDSVSFSQETSGSETIISVSGAWWLSARANPSYSSADFDEGNKIIKLRFTNNSGIINIHTSGWEGAPICKTHNWTK